MTASGRRCRIWTGKITLPARFIPDPAIRFAMARRRRSCRSRCAAPPAIVDILSRPFWLPETVDTGDWIEIGHIGAYSLSLRTLQRLYPDTFVEVTTPFDEGDAPQGFASLETRWLISVSGEW
jgi:ornithine decarboxylase